jgi:hypothetical protein
VNRWEKYIRIMKEEFDEPWKLEEDFDDRMSYNQ